MPWDIKSIVKAFGGFSLLSALLGSVDSDVPILGLISQIPLLCRHYVLIYSGIRVLVMTRRFTLVVPVPFCILCNMLMSLGKLGIAYGAAF